MIAIFSRNALPLLLFLVAASSSKAEYLRSGGYRNNDANGKDALLSKITNRLRPVLNETIRTTLEKEDPMTNLGEQATFDVGSVLMDVCKDVCTCKKCGEICVPGACVPGTDICGPEICGPNTACEVVYRACIADKNGLDISGKVCNTVCDAVSTKVLVEYGMASVSGLSDFAMTDLMLMLVPGNSDVDGPIVGEKSFEGTLSFTGRLPQLTAKTSATLRAENGVLPGVKETLRGTTLLNDIDVQACAKVTGKVGKLADKWAEISTIDIKTFDFNFNSVDIGLGLDCWDKLELTFDSSFYDFLKSVLGDDLQPIITSLLNEEIVKELPLSLEW